MPLPLTSIRTFCVLATMVAAALFGLSAPVPAPAQDLVKTTTVELAPGLTYTTVLDRSDPLRIFLLTMDPIASPAALDVTLARGALPGFATVSAMATREGAIAAVNGDFGMHPGRPVHGFADDGVLVQTPVVGTTGKSFAVSADEVDRYVGSPALAVRVFRYARGTSWRAMRWNEGAPGPGEVVGFTRMGGSVEVPPKRACSARMVPAGEPAFSGDQMQIQQDFTVEVVACQTEPMELGSGVVVSSRLRGTGATRITNLEPGETVSLSWTYGWRNVLDAIGGGPVLLDDGVVQVRHCEEWLCGRAPRTAIGVTADGKVLLMVVDGRRERWSVGMTLKETALYLKSLGAVDAINLDGGGSSEMWVNGAVVNKPSDGQERRVSSAVLVLPAPDTLVPASLAAVPSRPLLRSPEQLAADAAAWDAARTDPASTGGLLRFDP